MKSELRHDDRSRPQIAASRRPGFFLQPFLLTAALLFALVLGAAGAKDVTPSDRIKRSVVVSLELTTRSRFVGALRPGDVVHLEADAPGWFRVRLTDGTKGYVSKT
jgi:hypothetical protein